LNKGTILKLEVADDQLDRSPLLLNPPPSNIGRETAKPREEREEERPVLHLEY